MGALLVVMVVVASAVWVWTRSRSVPVPADLAPFEQVDLGRFAASDALVGVTRSNYLPMTITRAGRGKTSLAIVDAHSGTVIDAGPVPVDGWVTASYPRASGRFVATVTDVCPERPREGDAGLECVVASPFEPIGVQLSVYDIQAGTWATLRLDALSSQIVSLADVDGSTATLRKDNTAGGEPDTWATVDLTRPLHVGAFSTRSSIRPSGLAMSNDGSIDGWGWKARAVNEERAAATWIGTIDGHRDTISISTPPMRQLQGAGRCLVIGTFRPHHLDHLHRLCAS